MKKFAFQSIALLIIIFAALAFYSSKIPINFFLPTQLPTGEVFVNGVTLKVEVADTQQARNKGLGGRESLASDSGMLFVFEKVDKYPFWMKGLKFPLDFIWIRNDTIVDFLENIQPPKPDQTDQSLTIYGPKVAVNKVLEVSAGTIGRLNIKLGDKIKVVKN